MTQLRRRVGTGTHIVSFKDALIETQVFRIWELVINGLSSRACTSIQELVYPFSNRQAAGQAWTLYA